MKWYVPILVVMCVAGCSEPANEQDWYERSQAVKDEKAEYIRAQTEMGIGEVDAARQYDLNRAIKQTEGRDMRPIDAR